MFCVNCGTELSEQARFCAKCGHGVPGRTPLERAGRDLATGAKQVFAEHKDLAPLLGLVALALLQLIPSVLGFIPGIALIIIAAVRGWRWSATLLIVGRVGLLLLALPWFRMGSFVLPIHGSNPFLMWGSISSVLIGTILLFLERAGKLRQPSRLRATLVGCALVLTFTAQPLFAFIVDRMDRHTLTEVERQRANALLAVYSTKQWVCSAPASGRRQRQFAVNSPRYQADLYGMMAFSHTILLDGQEGSGYFQCSWKDIRLPDVVQYTMRNGHLLVRYASPDSVWIERHEQSGKTYPIVAISNDLLQAREQQRIADHQVRYQQCLDSLHANTRLYEGRFLRSECNVACTAVFTVNDNGAAVDILTYWPQLVVDGTDLRTLQPDATDWALTVRKSIPDPGVGAVLSTVPERLEVIGLKRIVAPVEASVPPAIVKPEAQATAKVPTAVKPAAPPEKKPLTEVDQPPVFDQGRTPFSKWVRDNLVYPADDKANGDVGKVVVSFVVEDDGRTTGIKVLRGRTAGMDAEARRLAGLMPMWSPAIKNGKPVRASHQVNIVFAL